MKKTCGLVCGSSAVGILRQPLLSRMRPRASMNRHSLLTKWYVKYYVNVLRTNCFSALFNYYVGMLRTICFLLSSPIALVCCVLFVFTFLKLLRWCVAHFLFYTFFNYHVGKLRTNSFLLSLTITFVCCALFLFYF